MDEPKYQDLVKAIAQAAWDSREYLRNHLRRNDKNDHSFISEFQKSVNNYLNNNYSKYKWYTEEKKSDTVVKDSIDIIGENSRRNCIIEIDAVRHDQIAPKFVSRLALWGLEEPIDYVILLYDSTLKSGKHSAEKFVRYTYSILKAINKQSNLIGIYVHTPKNPNKNDEDSLKIWDCDNQAFSINVKEYKNKAPMTMSECAREAIKFYIRKHKEIKYEDLQERFNDGITFITDRRGSSRENPIEMEIIGQDNKTHNIHVYSQFRYYGRQHNWNRFVEVCKGEKDMKPNDKITIIEIFKPDKNDKPTN